MLQAFGIVLCLACVALGIALIARPHSQLIRILTKTVNSSETKDELVMVRHPIAGTGFVLVGLALLTIAT
jgi:hypothetical protein